MFTLKNSLLTLLGIAVLSIAFSILYTNKLNTDFGINHLNELKKEMTILSGELAIVNQDIQDLDNQKKSKLEIKASKEKDLSIKLAKANEIEKAIFYLNKSLGRETI